MVLDNLRFIPIFAQQHPPITISSLRQFDGTPSCCSCRGRLVFGTSTDGWLGVINRAGRFTRKINFSVKTIAGIHALRARNSDIYVIASLRAGETIFLVLSLWFLLGQENYENSEFLLSDRSDVTTAAIGSNANRVFIAYSDGTIEEIQVDKGKIPSKRILYKEIIIGEENSSSMALLLSDGSLVWLFANEPFDCSNQKEDLKIHMTSNSLSLGRIVAVGEEGTIKICSVNTSNAQFAINDDTVSHLEWYNSQTIIIATAQSLIIVDLKDNFVAFRESHNCGIVAILSQPRGIWCIVKDEIGNFLLSVIDEMDLPAKVKVATEQYHNYAVAQSLAHDDMKLLGWSSLRHGEHLHRMGDFDGSLRAFIDAGRSGVWPILIVQRFMEKKHHARLAAYLEGFLKAQDNRLDRHMQWAIEGLAIFTKKFPKALQPPIDGPRIVRIFLDRGALDEAATVAILTHNHMAYFGVLNQQQRQLEMLKWMHKITNEMDNRPFLLDCWKAFGYEIAAASTDQIEMLYTLALYFEETLEDFLEPLKPLPLIVVAILERILLKTESKWAVEELLRQYLLQSDYEKAMNLLKKYSAIYEPTIAMNACAIADWQEGLEYLYERSECFEDLLLLLIIRENQQWERIMEIFFNVVHRKRKILPSFAWINILAAFAKSAPANVLIAVAKAMGDLLSPPVIIKTIAGANPDCPASLMRQLYGLTWSSLQEYLEMKERVNESLSHRTLKTEFPPLASRADSAMLSHVAYLIRPGSLDEPFLKTESVGENDEDAGLSEDEEGLDRITVDQFSGKAATNTTAMTVSSSSQSILQGIRSLYS